MHPGKSQSKISISICKSDTILNISYFPSARSFLAGNLSQCIAMTL